MELYCTVVEWDLRDRVEHVDISTECIYYTFYEYLKTINLSVQNMPREVVTPEIVE